MFWKKLYFYNIYLSMCVKRLKKLEAVKVIFIKLNHSNNYQLLECAFAAEDISKWE